MRSDTIAVISAIKSVYPAFDDATTAIPFKDLGVDSFDLLAMRAALAKALGKEITDRDWLAFKSFQDIRDHCAGRPRRRADHAARRFARHRAVTVNMPQMAVGGLSEQWLFKELGDFHWMMICEALGRRSNDILDDQGLRLYATFVRIRWEATSHLKTFRENEALRLSNSLARLGRGMFFSEAAVAGDGKSVAARLASTFTARDGGNKGLMKGEPLIPEGSPVPELPSMPSFTAEYRAMRKGQHTALTLAGQSIPFPAAALYETTYEINPYLDFNGVNLLYFAAYPMIADRCEREFARRHPKLGGRGEWAQRCSTVARDVFYYGNCDVDDSIIYRVHSHSARGRRFSIAASLSRKSDEKVIAHVFAVKELHA